MSKPRTSMLVGLLAALVVVCLATFTLYARQQKPAQPAETAATFTLEAGQQKPAQATDAACKCQPQGTTEGVAIIYCACPTMNCLVARLASASSDGGVSTSCK